MLSFVMLSVFMLNVVMVSVIMLNIMAPGKVLLLYFEFHNRVPNLLAGG
jgi:hypothetical protein